MMRAGNVEACPVPSTTHLLLVSYGGFLRGPRRAAILPPLRHGGDPRATRRAAVRGRRAPRRVRPARARGGRPRVLRRGRGRAALARAARAAAAAGVRRVLGRRASAAAWRAAAVVAAPLLCVPRVMEDARARADRPHADPGAAGHVARTTRRRRAASHTHTLVVAPPRTRTRRRAASQGESASRRRSDPRAERRTARGRTTGRALPIRSPCRTSRRAGERRAAHRRSDPRAERRAARTNDGPQVGSQQPSGRAPHDVPSLLSLWTEWGAVGPATYGIYDVTDFAELHPGAQVSGETDLTRDRPHTRGPRRARARAV